MVALSTLAASTISVPRMNPRFLNATNACHEFTFLRRSFLACHAALTPWDPSLLTHSPTDDISSKFIKTLKPKTPTERVQHLPSPQPMFFKWPMWVLGPSLLLATSVVPTLWLPLPSIFLGPNIASILSLTGLDCIFNLGATLFFLMADSCARPNCNARPPLSYRAWNVAASIIGFLIPAVMLVGSRGSLEPQLPFVSFAILLGPCILLQLVQAVTEVLTWHWRSPVWLVVPVVYEGYRVLQLMRGLKLGGELDVPTWAVHGIRVLVCWWVLVLGTQLMRVAWIASFSARAGEQKSAAGGHDA